MRKAETELRRAAHVLSTHAYNATQPPWFSVENDLIGGWTLSQSNKPVSQNNITQIDIADFCKREDTAYLEKIDPGVGQLFASILVHLADLVQDYPQLGRPHVRYDSCEDHACRMVHTGQRIAALILQKGDSMTPSRYQADSLAWKDTEDE